MASCLDAARTQRQVIRRTLTEAETLTHSQRKTRMRRLLAVSPRLAHRQIFHAPRTGPPEALTDTIKHATTKQTISGPPALAYAHSHFTAEWGTHTNPNSHAPYPWESQTNPDPFTLQTMATGRPELTVLPAILDFAAFTRSVSRLSNNKAPGPDGFPNELIKALPPSFHRALHSLFILFWLTGHAPTTWKTSETTLLHKRGDPLLFDSKRPIGLGRSVYKLYTRFVTDCLSTFADQYGIFSETQEGCLPRRSPARQLMRLTLAIKDAAWTQSDLFILHTDMSSAFNRVDHPCSCAS
jgi:hypothetical protein